MKYIATLNGKRYEVEIERINDFTPVPRGAAAEAIPAAAPIAAPVAPAPAAAPAAAGAANVTAPMPGTVLDVKVSVGQAVQAGETVVVLEAMKMENEIPAPVAGTVTGILVQKGATVDTDAVLVILG